MSVTNTAEFQCRFCQFINATITFYLRTRVLWLLLYVANYSP